MEDKQIVSKENQEIFEQFDTDLKQIKVLIKKYKDFESKFMEKTVEYYMHLEMIRVESFKEITQIESSISHNSSSFEIMKSLSNIFEAFFKFVTNFSEKASFFEKSFHNLDQIATEIENTFSNYGDIKHYYNSICYTNKLIELEITKNLVKEKYKGELVSDAQNKTLEELVKKSKYDENLLFGSKELIMRQIRTKTSAFEKNLKEDFANFFLELRKMRNDFVEVEEREKKRIEDLFVDTDDKNNKILNLLVNFDYFKYTPTIISNNSFKVKREENVNVLILNDQDIYDIVSKLYGLDLQLINKSEFNLEKKNKFLIEIKPLIERILSFNLDEDNKNPMDSTEISKLYPLLENDKDYLLDYLKMLNDYRKRRREMKKSVFELNQKIFDNISNILDEKYNIINNNLIDLQYYFLILADTFYEKTNDDKKENYLSNYLSKGAIKNKFLNNIRTWQSAIKRMIEFEKTKTKENDIKKIKENIVKPILLSFINSMYSFNVPQAVIDSILEGITKEYKYTDNETKVLKDLLKTLK